MQQAISGNYRLGTKNIILWTIVCAMVPTLMGIAVTALNKQILHADSYATLIRGITLVAVLGLPLLCVGLQWYVLRRFAPSLALWLWAGAAVVTLVSSGLLLVLGSSRRDRLHFGANPQRFWSSMKVPVKSGNASRLENSIHWLSLLTNAGSSCTRPEQRS